MENAEKGIIKKVLNGIENYASITQDYPVLKFKKNQSKKQKVKYINPEDYDKVLNIISSDPIITIKEPQIKIPYKTSKYIKFRIDMPMTEGLYRPLIIICNVRTGEIEEIMRLSLEVVENY